MASFIKKDLTLSTSVRGLVIGFALIVAVMVILAVVAVWRFDQVKLKFETVVDVYNVRVELAQHMRVIARERSPILYAIIITEDPFEADDLIMELQRQGAAFLQTREKLIATGLNPNELEKLEQHREFAREIVAKQRQIIDWVRAGRHEEASRFMVNEVSPAQIESLQQLDAFIALEKEKSQLSVNQARESFKVTLRDIGITAIFGTLFSLVVGMIISLRFSHFVNALETANTVLEEKVDERTHELQDANERLQQLASFDSLTGLPNRSLFLEHLELSMKRAVRHKHCIGMLFIDLDHFKNVNDDHGHDYGDELLRQVAERLLTCAREEDVVARLGGDEFTVILNNLVNTESAGEVSQRIIDTISKPFSILDAECHIGCSIGIALYPMHADSLDELIKCADEAMYDVKGSGKNSYHICEEPRSGCSDRSPPES
ncbi:MAG: diguanylate cyclase [Candidatus Sedimenticola sp. (ex Thyasira tokunagai)]